MKWSAAARNTRPSDILLHHYCNVTPRSCYQLYYSLVCLTASNRSGNDGITTWSKLLLRDFVNISPINKHIQYLVYVTPNIGDIIWTISTIWMILLKFFVTDSDNKILACSSPQASFNNLWQSQTILDNLLHILLDNLWQPLTTFDNLWHHLTTFDNNRY